MNKNTKMYRPSLLRPILLVVPFVLALDATILYGNKKPTPAVVISAVLLTFAVVFLLLQIAVERIIVAGPSVKVRSLREMLVFVSGAGNWRKEDVQYGVFWRRRMSILHISETDGKRTAINLSLYSTKSQDDLESAFRERFRHAR